MVVVEQARFHVPVVRANSTWEEKDKAAGLLNFREFLVCQLLMFSHDGSADFMLRVFGLACCFLLACSDPHGVSNVRDGPLRK